VDQEVSGAAPAPARPHAGHKASPRRLRPVAAALFQRGADHGAFQPGHRAGRVAGVSGIFGGLLAPTKGDVSWRALSNDKFLSAGAGGLTPVVALAEVLTPAETFTRLQNADGSTSLQSTANGKYLSVANGGALNTSAGGPGCHRLMISLSVTRLRGGGLLTGTP
jgi:hypothetical protein